MEECRNWVTPDVPLEEAIKICMEDRYAYKEAVVFIDINQENGELTVGEIDGDFGVYRDVDDDTEYIDYLNENWYLTDEEWNQVAGLTEKFLNAAVDLDKM